MLLLLSQGYPGGLNSDTNEETLASGDASKVADLNWGRNGMSELVKIDFPPLASPETTPSMPDSQSHQEVLPCTDPKSFLR